MTTRTFKVYCRITARLNTGSLIIKEIHEFNSTLFRDSLKIYDRFFGHSVFSRPPEKVVTMFKHDRNYHLFVATLDNSVIGISLLYIFSSLQIGLLDYITVVHEYRQKGIGKRLFTYTLDELRKYLVAPIGLLIEVQKEGDSDNRDTNKKRIKFYADLGAKLIEDICYLIPVQYTLNSKEMHLMMWPFKELSYVTKDSLIQYVRAIYSIIYEYPKNDLLERTFQTSPGIIKLSSPPC